MHPYGKANIPAAATEFETALLSLRSDLGTYASWLSSGDTKVLSTMKQLRSNTSSLTRWDGRTQSVKKQLAQARLSAMAHIEHRLASQAKTASKSSQSSENVLGEEEIADSKALAEATGALSLQAYENDFETRKENLTNRFDLMSHSVFGKPLYPEVVPSEGGLFMTDPSAPTDGSASRALLLKNGILSDAGAKLRLTLASDCSMIDIQVDAYGQYLEVTYDYDAPVRFIARWLLEALKEGNTGVAEEIIRSSYVDRCLRHLAICSSLQSQYAESLKSATPAELKFDSWAIPGLNLPTDHSSIHARLCSLERDVITIARLETLKYGVSSLWKGSGWMTMNARGPVLTFFALPSRLGAVAASLLLGSSANGALSNTLSVASQEHLALLEALPLLDPTNMSVFNDLPAYTSNVLAPVILSRLRPGSSLCSGHLKSAALGPEVSQSGFDGFSMKDVDALAFHLEIEQGRVTDPNSQRALRCAPRSTSSAISFFNYHEPSPNAVHVGTSLALTESDASTFFKAMSPSLDSSLENPADFLDAGLQWFPFGQHDTIEDQHLPLCLKLRLEQDIPFYSSLFYRLRAIAASPDPLSLLKNYHATDEAHRTGNVPPEASEAPKPKKITFRTSKSTTVVSSATPTPAPTPSPFSGTTLACLFSRKEASIEPCTEDVVLQLPLPTQSEGSSRAVRCLHTHHTTSTPSALMVRSVSFVDARQLRALVSILRQQAVLNALFASCFLDDSALPYSVYAASLQKRGTGGAHIHHDPLRSSAGGPSISRSQLHSSTNLNASFDLSSPPRNRNKRSRTEMETSGLASPEALKRPTADGKSHEHLTEAVSEQNCHMSIELSALMQPLFGWSVMVVSNPGGAHKGPDSPPPTIFSFSVHVAIDGYVHVVPSDLSAVTSEHRNQKRLENLLRATFNIPLALALWMKDPVV